jgi:lipopolysaccharide O-acetyltransferase
MRRQAATEFLRLAGLTARARGKAFSLLAGPGFAGFGRRSVLQPPIRLGGARRIAVGSGVYVGAGSWLQVLDGEGDGVALEIGDGTSIVGACVISAARSVRLGRHVLLARNVYIADHQHAFEDIRRPVLAQGITRVGPVEIGDGAWLGENVVVGPGVRIGRGAVVGANAVVLSSVPDHCVAVGAPARVVRSFAVAEPAVAGVGADSDERRTVD